MAPGSSPVFSSNELPALGTRSSRSSSCSGCNCSRAVVPSPSLSPSNDSLSLSQTQIEAEISEVPDQLLAPPSEDPATTRVVAGDIVAPGTISDCSFDSSSRSPPLSPSKDSSSTSQTLVVIADLVAPGPSPAPPSSNAPTPTPKTPQIVDSNYRPFIQKVSAAKQEWQRRKDDQKWRQKESGDEEDSSDNKNSSEDESDEEDSSEDEDDSNKAIDNLMELVGLEQVKQQVLVISAKIEICKRQKTNLRDERFHVVFQGNPGTGKTTVARIYAKFLKTSGVLDSGMVTETSGAKLAYGGPKLAQKMIEEILGAGGGVLFVDEAYQLTAPHATSEGRQVLDIILTEMENHIGKLVVIFVGYNDEMQSFFEHNPGLASRIPYTLQFADFEDVELWNILRSTIEKKYNGEMKVEGGMGGLFMRVAIRRLATGRGIRNFGNARAVQNLLARISERQANRLTEERKAGTHKDPLTQDYFFFAKEDIIGPDPSKAVFKSTAWTKLQGLIGLDEVKMSAKGMIDMIVTNYRRELAERKPLNFSLNRVFFGGPGTGKTTVARLYGQILADIGLLSNGEVIIKNPTDFIGQCLGKSEAKTRAILAMSIGKVLIIDEAYMLDSGGDKQDTFKTAVIDTLVAEVQSVPGDDRCVLVLGYEDKLKAMFQRVNPGLSRRFAIDDPFRFQDFNVPQLENILKLKMKGEDLTANPRALSVALEVLSRAQMRPNFGNGGEVDNCLAKAKLNYQNRQSKKAIDDRYFDCVFEPEDFDPDFRRNGKVNCRQQLHGQVSEDIIKTLEDYIIKAAEAREDGLDPRKEIPTKIIFKGPPGTGKTTTAKNMGRVYYDMGFLSTPEVIECSASDLIGQFVGQTGPKTKEQLDRALGKVLFVDEAYRLAEGQYALEAVNELIYLLTTPRYESRMVVILAGYSQDMNKLMAARPTLSSLFPDEITFRDLTPKDCLALLGRELELKRTSAVFLEKIESEEYAKLRRLIKSLSLLPAWGNARDIKILAKKMSASATRGKTSDGKPTRSLSAMKALECTRDMVALRHGRSYQQEGYGVKYPPTPPETGIAASERSEPQISSPIHHEPLACHTCVESSGPLVHTTQLHAQNAPCILLKATEPPSQVPRRRPRDDTDATRDDGVTDAIWNELQNDRENQEIRQKKKGREERRKDKATQERLRQIGNCWAGYDWIEQSGGYRCLGGACFISYDQLGET